jgi:hypothetical protein
VQPSLLTAAVEAQSQGGDPSVMAVPNPKVAETGRHDNTRSRATMTELEGTALTFQGGNSFHDLTHRSLSDKGIEFPRFRKMCATCPSRHVVLDDRRSVPEAKDGQGSKLDL